MPSSKGEDTTKILVENYFECEFVKIRPGWLKNPKTGCNLELDMYSDSKKLAIEYQGQQHYYYSPHFHKNDINNFYDQQERDKYKVEECKRLGISLIQIPYFWDRNDIIFHLNEKYPIFFYSDYMCISFNKPIAISKSMAQFTGWDISKKYSRRDIVDYVLKYIHDNKLRNRVKKTVFIDKKLRTIMKKRDKTIPPSKSSLGKHMYAYPLIMSSIS